MNNLAQAVVVGLIVASIALPVLLVVLNTQIRAVFKREFMQYFRSPIAYGIAFALLFFMGLLFSANLSQASQRFTADQLNTMPQVLAFLLFLVAPLLTMRLLAEEAREGTLETLMTLPLNEMAFITGKFLAVWAYYTILVGLTAIYLLLLSTIGTPDTGKALGIYYGLWLYGGAVLAVSLIWSAVTEDQIVAAFLSAATVLTLYLSDIAVTWISSIQLENPALTAALTNFVRELGLTAHYQDTMYGGVIRAEDILYFGFMMAAALFIATRIIETRRWRG